MEMLLNHTWTGNIRELKNIMERAVILADSNCLEICDLPPGFNPSAEFKSDVLLLSEVEKQHIHRVLHLTHGNKSETARLLGIGLTTLYRKIEEYHIVA